MTNPSQLLHTGHAGYERCMTRLRGKTAVDVGANDGGYVGPFLEHGASRVVAVEPAPRLVASMRQRFADQPVTVVQCGLSDAPSHATDVSFYNCWTLGRPGELTGRIADPSPGAREVQPEPFDVRFVTLDRLVRRLQVDDLSFLKIDVDGYEPRVLRGARQTLEKQRPDILLELSYLPHDLGESIEAFLTGIYAIGYTLMTLDGRAMSERFVMEHYPWDTSLDVLMVPVDRYPVTAP